jgi:SAM-dependent methyltransferase
MERGLDLTSRAEATHFWFRGFRQFVSPIIETLAAGRRGLQLVDCGCGTGNNLALLAPYGRVRAFDLTQWGARRALSSGHQVVRADITSIPFSSERFDVATSFDVLQCVEADDLAVREIARIVRPGGVIVLTLAAFDWLRGDHAISWNERRRYTPSRARLLVEQAGVRAERVSFMFASVFPAIAATRLTQRLLRPIRGVRDDLDMTVPASPINQTLSALVRAEAVLVRRGWRMPIGSSIVVVARKP